MNTVENLVDLGLDSDSTPSPAGGSVSNFLADGDTAANVVDENLKKTLEAGMQLPVLIRVPYSPYSTYCELYDIGILLYYGRMSRNLRLYVVICYMAMDMLLLYYFYSFAFDFH